MWSKTRKRLSRDLLKKYPVNIMYHSVNCLKIGRLYLGEEVQTGAVNPGTKLNIIYVDEFSG